MDPTTTPLVPLAEALQQTEMAEAGLTSEQTAQLTEWARADLVAGKISQAQFDQQAEELNLSPADRALDTRSDEVIDLDLHFPPAKESDYVIHYGQENLTPELKAFDTSARTWLAGAGFPRNLGSSLVKAIDEVTRQTASMNEDQLAEFGYREYAKLQHLYGPSLTERLHKAGQMVHQLELEKPGLKQLLKSRGIGDSARVVVLLLDQSERYWRRRKG